MRIFPIHSEILVSPLSKTEVLNKVDEVTQDVNFLDYINRTDNSYKFNGQVDERSFRISLIVNKADSFLPLIRGQVEPTGKGSIIFLNYSFFPGSMFFIGLWTGITLALGLFFLLLANMPGYASLCFLAGGGNYLFALLHFKRKIKASKNVFENILILQTMD